MELRNGKGVSGPARPVIYTATFGGHEYDADAEDTGVAALTAEGGAF